MTEIFGLDEETKDIIYVVKKNCLKVIKVEEFSEESVFIDPCRTFILKNVICELCSNSKDIDFCRDKKFLAKKWQCDECHTSYDTDLIEFNLLQKLKLIIDYYLNQDLECVKCKMQKNEYCWTACKCSGEYAETFSSHIFTGFHNIKNLSDLFSTISIICNYYEFTTVKSYLSRVLNA